MDYGPVEFVGYMNITALSSDGGTNDIVTFSTEFKVGDATTIEVNELTAVAVTGVTVTPATSTGTAGGASTFTVNIAPYRRNQQRLHCSDYRCDQSNGYRLWQHRYRDACRHRQCADHHQHRRRKLCSRAYGYRYLTDIPKGGVLPLIMTVYWNAYDRFNRYWRNLRQRQSRRRKRLPAPTFI